MDEIIIFEDRYKDDCGVILILNNKKEILFLVLDAELENMMFGC